MKSLLISLLFVCLAGKDVFGGRIESRIINGNVAIPNQFPYHVTVQGQLSNGQTTLCGGALISNAYVITAAHCVANIPTITLGFGSNNLTTPQIAMVSSSRIVHPQYNASSFANDIVLLRLPLNLTNSVSIATIRLPALSQNNTLFINSTATISGFGRVTDQSAVSPSLRYAATRIIPNAECVQAFGTFYVQNSTICAVGRDFNAQGPCANDNGGPLVLSEVSGNTLIGIHSFISNAGCVAGHPAGYTRISPYTQWISQQIGIPTRP